MSIKRVPKGTKTYENLKIAFQGESMANRDTYTTQEWLSNWGGLMT